MTASTLVTTGNVGIGTATPAYRFDMPAGDMAISGRLLGLTSPGNLFWLGLRGTATESQRLAIGINGDPITGILSGVQMGINGGGLFVNSSNYVGIGTATPSAQLSIHGNTSSWSSTSLLGITNTNATPNASLYLIAPNMTANQPHAITLGKALTQYNSMQWIYTHIANDSTDNYMNFTPYGGTVNGIGCLYLRATGNVGIGVTNPFGFFQIACTSSTSQGTSPDGGDSHGLVFTSPKTGTSVYAMAMGVDFTTGYGYINGAGNTQTQSILLQSRGGNVGIGTNNPGSTLHVVGDIRMQITYAFFLYYLSGVNHAAISTNSNGDMLFSTGTGGVATRMTIDSNGNVGIGTQSPTHALHIYGTSRIISPIAGDFNINLDCTVTGNPNNFIGFSVNGQSGGRITGTASSTTYQTSSDIRIKKEIDYTFDGLSLLHKLKPCSFKYIAEDNNKDIFHGFIAQDVKQVLPQYVHGDESKETLMMDYTQLTGILVQSILQQSTQISSLQSQLTQVLSQVAALTDRLAAANIA
jgi:hypothetical protein